MAITGTSKTLLSDLTLANLSSSNPNAVGSDFKASINWGDGKTTPGTLVDFTGGNFSVTGSHTYTEGGTYAVTISITNDTNAVTMVTSTANISNLLVTLSGGASTLNGTVSSTGLTNVSKPVFTGTAEALSIVSVYAVPANGTNPVLIAKAQTNASGQFTAPSTVSLSDGQYTVEASSVDLGGQTNSAMTTLYPTGSRGVLTVDTQGPKVVSASLTPRTGRSRSL